MSKLLNDKETSLLKFCLYYDGIDKSIENELRNIIGKDFKGLKMLFCTTASNYEGGDMNEWLIEDLITLRNLPWSPPI